MSKEKVCKCCNQIWYVDMLDKKLKLCPNCYEYCKPLFDDLKIKDKQIAEVQDKISFVVEQLQWLKEKVDNAKIHKINMINTYELYEILDNQIKQLKEKNNG